MAIPADAVSTAPPASRRLRLCELALVMGVAFLTPAVVSLHAWWTGAKALPPASGFHSLLRILDAALAIAVLAYVLHRQGRSLRTIGLTAKPSDLFWAAAVVLLSRAVATAVQLTLAVSLTLGKAEAFRLDPSLLGWLAILPSAAEEELIVRAFLMTEVAEMTGHMGIAVLASVGFQILYHLYQGGPVALMAAGRFFVYAVFYASKRRITPVVLAHAWQNFAILASYG